MIEFGRKTYSILYFAILLSIMLFANIRDFLFSILIVIVSIRASKIKKDITPFWIGVFGIYGVQLTARITGYSQMFPIKSISELILVLFVILMAAAISLTATSLISDDSRKENQRMDLI